MNDSRKMAAIAVEALQDKKAIDLKVIDIKDVSVMADYFIIVSGSNKNQVQALADNAEEMLGKAGYNPRQVEGYRSANWILMDYQDIIIHIFSEEDRLFYDLERIWRDGKTIALEELVEGYRSANWILMDYQDIIIHIFSEEDRLFYDLERIWRDGKTIALEELSE